MRPSYTRIWPLKSMSGAILRAPRSAGAGCSDSHCASKTEQPKGRTGTRGAILAALIFTGCTAAAPALWTPYDPAAEWECYSRAWNESWRRYVENASDWGAFEVLRDRTPGGVYVSEIYDTVYSKCLEGKGFARR